MSEKLISIKVISPTRSFFEGEVKSFIVKTNGEVGEFAVLVDHAPIAAAVGLGTLVLEMPDGERKESTLFGGYLVCQNNNAVLLAESCEWPDEIDVDRAKAAMKRAEERLNDSEMDHQRAQRAFVRAKTRLNLSKLHK